MDKPLVSVGIAAYGKPDSLKTTLQCITDQTYPNLEIIVSDDCSPNKEVSRVVNEVMLTEPRIRFYRQNTNLGAALNAAFVLDKATGKYFIWADDEDFCEPEFVEKILNCMESQPDLVACGCDVNSVDLHDQFIYLHQLDTIRPMADWNQARKLFFQYPTSDIYLCVLGMFKTEELRKTGIQHWVSWKDYTINCEVPFLAQIATYGRIAAIPEVLKTYRRNPNSVYHTESSTISQFDLFMVRLAIRFRLCKIAVINRLPVKVKLSLLKSILVSLVKETKIYSMFMSFMGTVKKMDERGNLSALLVRAKKMDFIKNIIHFILRKIFGLEVHWIKHIPPGGIVKLIADKARLEADKARLEADKARLEAELVELKQQKAEIRSALDDLQSIHTKLQKMAEIQIVSSLQKFEIDLILDVGANIGQFGKEMRQCGYEGRIVSFEPLSQAHDLLLQSSAGDHMWDVSSRCALGDHTGEVEINIAGNSQSSSILPMLESHRSAAPESEYQGKEITPIKTLDSVAGQYLKDARAPFLKIDTQGFEWQVLDGARETLPHIKGVLVELSLVPLYGGQHLWREVIDRLEAEGFALWAFNPVFSDQAMGRTLQVDGVFFRSI